MLADNLGPLLGTNVIDSVYWAFQGSDVRERDHDGTHQRLVNVVTTIGTLDLGSTISNNTAPLPPPPA